MFIELSIIRSNEFGVAAPWTRLAAGVAARLRRPETKYGAADFRATATLTAYGRARPGGVTADATEGDRIARLESYVEYIDRDLSAMHQAVEAAKLEAVAAAREGDDGIRQEIERGEAERHTRLRRSVARQAAGATLLLVGIVASTIGSLS